MLAYIYTRFSPRPFAQDCNSCDKQIERCRAFCKSRNHDIIGVFRDENVSGTITERLAMNEIIFLLAEKKDEDRVVVIDSPDRLARDMMVGLVLRERIVRAGGKLVYADGSTTGNSPEDTFISNMMLALATLERDRVSYRTSRGMQRRMAAGEFFGKAPIGWMRLGGKGTRLIPCKPEREAIYKARRLFKKGFSRSAVAQVLQRYGSLRGKVWNKRTVSKMAKKRHSWEEENNNG